jgi:hypothetical protein
LQVAVVAVPQAHRIVVVVVQEDSAPVLELLEVITLQKQL